MKILFPYMARWHAVNWTRYHSLLTVMADKGHEVVVLQPPALDSSETNYQEIEAVAHRNIEIIDVPVPDFLWKRKFPLEKLVKKALYSLYAYRHSRRLVAEKGIDTILLYNIPQYQFSRIGGVDQIFDYADDYINMLEIELGPLSNPLTSALASRMLRNMMTRARYTLSVSHELGRSAWGNVRVIPNGVGAGDALPAERLDERPAIQGDRMVVGFLGAFEYFIDLDLILDAAQRLPDVDFLLVGSGREWERVRARVDDEGLGNVTLTGGVPHSEVFGYIRKMDVCLNVFKKIPVSHRACPIKLFEYMSQGRPVVSTRLDELRHIDKGYLYYADDVDEMVETLRAIRGQPEQAMARARQGYQDTMSSYTWEKLADDVIALLEE